MRARERGLEAIVRVIWRIILAVVGADMIAGAVVDGDAIELEMGKSGMQ